MQLKSLAATFIAVTLLSPIAGEVVAADAPAKIAPQVVLPIWPGIAPGSEKAQQQEKTSLFPTGKFSVIRNVTRPTLAVYLPDAALATGTGVIIAPGGSFRFLTIDAEGNDVAQWLTAHGIAAFVLKYRVVATPVDDGAMWREVLMLMSSTAALMSSIDEDGKPGVADGVQAVKVVREHAKEWGIAANRVGFVGFSAGAMVASHALLHATASERPDFVAPIYGAPFGAMPVIPAQLPPVFMAYASDDKLAGSRVAEFYAALGKAGHHPELHVYSKGGHGFGMNKQGTSSDYWIEDLYHWMESLGLTKAAGSAVK
jgi:acetyl esterase/lipase